MRLLGILAIACLYLIAGAANATTLSILETTGGNPDALGVGETITVSVVVTLDPGEEINAIGTSFYDWSNSVVGFVSGVAVDEHFFQTPAMQPDPNAPICTPYPALCAPSDPITNSLGGALTEGTASAGTGFFGVPEVEITASIALTETFVEQTFADPGLDGDAGTAQFDLTFQGVAAGTTTMIIGFGSDLNGVTGGPSIVPNTNTSLTMTVPEPGSLAASLAALSSVVGVVVLRRRR
jgi:hypothetical protein